MKNNKKLNDSKLNSVTGGGVPIVNSKLKGDQDEYTFVCNSCDHIFTSTTNLNVTCPICGSDKVKEIDNSLRAARPI